MTGGSSETPSCFFSLISWFHVSRRSLNVLKKQQDEALQALWHLIVSSSLNKIPVEQTGTRGLLTHSNPAAFKDDFSLTSHTHHPSLSAPQPCNQHVLHNNTWNMYLHCYTQFLSTGKSAGSCFALHILLNARSGRQPLSAL